MLRPCRITTRPVGVGEPAALVGERRLGAWRRRRRRATSARAGPRGGRDEPRATPHGAAASATRGHRLDVGAGEAADDGHVERLVGGERRLRASSRSAAATPTVPSGSPRRVEVVAVAVVEVAVERLLLREALGGVVADRGAHVAEHRRRLAAGLGGAGLDVLAGVGGELGRHPVEEGAVVARRRRARTSSGPSPRARGARRAAPRAARRAPRASSVSGFFEKPAPTPSQSRVAVEPEPLDVAGDLGRARGGRAPSPRRRARASGAASAKTASVSRPERAGMVVGPHRGVAELRAARRERRRRPPGRARRRRRTRAPAHRSTSLEQRHALDVRRLREHVDRLHAAQRIAGLDELRGVRGQRRRVAGDVDDPRRLALEQRGGRSSSRGPARGGSTTTTSGRPASLEQRRDPEPRVGGDEAGVRRSRSASALCSASAIASGTPSRPQTSPARAREREADRADPAVEVEDALAAARARRTRRRSRRGARPSRCWSAGRRVWRDRGSAARRAPRSGARRRARRSARRCRRPGPRSPCAGRPAGAGSRSGEVTSRVWSWPVRRPSRTTRLRRTPVCGAAVVGGERLGRAPTRGPRCGPRCWPPRRAGSRRRRRSRPSCRGGGSRARARRRRCAPNEYSSLLR